MEQINDTLHKMICQMKQGGTVVVRVMLGGWHYMLLTGIKGNYVSAFDLLNQESKEEYALGELVQRECMLLYNTTTRRTIDSTDYVI